MPLDLVRENMAINNKIGKETTQVLCEGDVIVPDTKPDIKSVHKITGKVFIDEDKASENRVSFKGRLKANILYTGKNGEKEMYAITSTINFEDFINMEGVTKDSDINTTANLEHIEYNVINDRKIGIKAVITVTVEADEDKDIDIITDIYDKGDIQTKTETISVNKIVQRKKDRFAVKEEFSIPSNMSNIFQILQSDIDIINKEIKVMDDKLSVKGILRASILYSADEDEGIVEVFEKEIPFNGYIEMDGITSEMIPNVELKVLDESVDVKPNDDGEPRNIEVDASVGVNAMVTDNQDVEMIDDVYSINQNTNIAREPITYPQFVGKNNTQSTLRETITIDGKYKEPLQIIKVWGNVRLDGVTVEDEKLIAQGVINLEVMYIAKNDDNPIEVIPVAIPFEQEIEIKGLSEDMIAEVSVAIENIAFNMLSDREVEFRTTLDIDAYVIQNKNGYVVKQVEFTEDGQQYLRDIGTIVIYVVQPGDTLWNIAKKYNTTVDNITSINDIENPDRIYPGQKILLLKE